MKKGTRETMDGIELTNQDSIRTLEEKENYKYLRILEEDTIKQMKTDEIKSKKEKKRKKKNPGKFTTKKAK